ncbi:MAG: hypothetical protein M3P00_11435 [Gemmatimonadota bacterium]|nr:hypothetical protein [Gemmatimonadota bacterium]
MTDPRPLTFEEGWADAVFDGVPLTECVLDAFVGRCQVCGADPEDQCEGTVLDNALVVEGTLYGDAFCAGCFGGHSAGPMFVLPPLGWEDGN